jgi:hypothetical protein
MKTLKKYNQFINEEYEYGQYNDLEEIMDNYMETLKGEYDYIIRGWNSDNFTIEIYHVADERGDPGEDFKEQIASDNAESAETLINLLRAEGWGIWQSDKPTYMGFTLTQTSDPRDSSDTVRWHRED